MNQKALLIRVGVDLKSGGFLGTINKNDEFNWIHIPGHDDPKWNELTYGDKGKATKISQLLQLKFNDLLVFYAGLINPNGEKGIYIIGYYIVKKIYDIRVLSVQERYKLKERELNNFKNPHLEDNFLGDPNIKNVLIIGESGGLLKKGIKIGSLIPVSSTGRYIMDDDYHYLGYDGDLTQAGSAHWIKYEETWNLLKNKNLGI